jgi:hypothetical protein
VVFRRLKHIKARSPMPSTPAPAPIAMPAMAPPPRDDFLLLQYPLLSQFSESLPPVTVPTEVCTVLDARLVDVPMADARLVDVPVADATTTDEYVWCEESDFGTLHCIPAPNVVGHALSGITIGFRPTLKDGQYCGRRMWISENLRSALFCHDLESGYESIS